MTQCRWFEDDLESEVIFLCVAHVLDHSPLPIPLRRHRAKLVDYFDVPLDCPCSFTKLVLAPIPDLSGFCGMKNFKNSPLGRFHPSRALIECHPAG